MINSDFRYDFVNKFKNKRIALWGVGVNLSEKTDFVMKYICPQICIDSNEELWGKEIIPGVICKSPTELNENVDIVVITPMHGSIINAIRTMLDVRFEVYTLNQIFDEIEIDRQETSDFGEESDRIKHFSCEIGSCACNINCSYCYVDFQDPKLKYNMHFSHSVSFIMKALSRKRLGGRAFFNICGEGETLLKHGFIELVHGLLEEGHYVGIITNGTVTPKLKELLAFPEDMKERMLIQFSCHYLELKRQNMIDVYFDNVNLVRNGGVSVCTTMPGSDEYLPYKDEIKKIALDKTGFLPVISPIRAESKQGQGFPHGSKLPWNEYMDIWDDFGSRSIEIRNETLGKFTGQCYAGINSGWINMETGELRSCIPGEHVDNIYTDISSKIRFWEQPHSCGEGYCSHNGMFLSGRENQSVTLPTWYEMFSRIDVDGNPTFIGKMKEATDYCCEY